jgi:opacity protein-like surface antigen
MIKKALSLLALTIGASSVYAQIYAQFALGSGDIAATCVTGATSCTTYQKLGYKILGGYELGNGFSAEVMHIKYGKFKADTTTVTSLINVTGLGFGGAFRLAFTDQWSYRLGLAVLRNQAFASATATGVTTDLANNSTQFNVNAGLIYQINPKMSVFTEYDASHTKLLDSTGATIKPSIGLFSVGVRANF